MRLLFDEDVDQRVLRGLLRRVPAAVEITTPHQLGMTGTPDIDLLRLAARDGRLVVSSDVSTMTDAFYQLLAAGEPTAGLLISPQGLPDEDWIDTLEWLPL